MDGFLKRFSGVVEKHRHDLAVADFELEYDYEQLDAASDRLARLLYETRSGENDVCVFLGDTSVDRITAYMACIKAGTVMMRLDPEAPAQVIQDLIETCEVARIIAQPAYMDQARAIFPKEPLLVPQEMPVRSEIEPFLCTDCRSDHLVAIQTTSGSTGRPKCVPITRAEVDVRMWRKSHYEPPVEPRRRIPFFTHLRVFHELLALQNADIIDCFDLRRYGSAAAVDYIVSRRMTAITGQVSLYRQLLNAAKGPFTDVNHVAVVGEAVLRSDLEQFEKFFLPGSKFVARFGGTEHCDLAVWTHRHGDPIRYDVMPLGPPLFDGEVTLIRESGEPAVTGEPGEIIVTADFLPTGYIKNPEKTAEAFFTDPATGKRSYRTGFIAYQDIDGVLHPYGRKDELVKIRGYNVRPSEVEQMAQSHPGIRQAAVVPFEGARGIRRLACFFVPANAEPPSARELSAFMAERSPSYFVPSIFHPVDALPLSSSGKVVKSQLPDPAGLQPAVNDLAAGFNGPDEVAVAKIWTEILGHADFGPDDDFFDVGGDSFQAMAMLVDIEKQFGARLPLEGLILDGAAVPVIARKLRNGAGGVQDGRAIVLRRGDDVAPLFAPHVIGGHLSDYLELAHALPPGQALVGLHPKGLDGKDRTASTMQELAADAIEAMRSHTREGPYRLLGYSYGAIVAFAMAEQLAAQGERVSHLILLDPQSTKTDLTRFAKAVYRPLKTGDLRKSARRLTRTVPAALGLREAPGQIDEAHRTAALRYQPAPITVPNALIVSATMNPHSVSFRKEWMRLLSGQADIVEIDARHETMVRQPAVWGLAQSVQAYLGGR